MIQRIYFTTAAIFIFSFLQSQSFSEIALLSGEGDPTFADLEQFGYSIDTEQGTLIVSAPLGNSSGTITGEVLVYERNQIECNLIKTLIPSDGLDGDRFGISVSISNDIIVVGAYAEDNSGLSSGAAYVFYKDYGGINNWGEVKKLTASDASSSDFFGQSVAIEDSIIIIGSPQDDDNGTNSGSAYIYSKNLGGQDNWGELKKLSASNASSGDKFGYSIVFNNSQIIIGSIFEDEFKSNSGAAYIYYKDFGGIDNWGELKKLKASDPDSGALFGNSLDIQDTLLVIGAFEHDNRGAAYIFSKNLGGIDNWGELKKLDEANGRAFDKFGYSVQIENEYIAIGDINDIGASNYEGVGFLYSKDLGGPNNWGLFSKILSPDGENNDRFGRSISMIGEDLFIGVPGDNFQGNDSGSVHLYNNTGGLWQSIKILYPKPSAKGDLFGHSVAIDNQIAIISAIGDNDAGAHGGSAYIYQQNQSSTTLIKKLAPDDVHFPDAFGDDVAINNSVAIVSAPNDFIDGYRRGSVYIFERDQGGFNNWGITNKLFVDDGRTDDDFGSSIDLLDDIIVVGADGDDDSGTDSGTVYIFYRNQGGPNNWGLVKKLISLDDSNLNSFGKSIALDNDILVVGSVREATVYGKDIGGIGNWGLIKVLTAPDISNGGGAGFGESVDIEDSIIIVGADADQEDTSRRGSSYVFFKDNGGPDNWGFQQKLVPFDGEGDYFGESLSLSDDILVVGAQFDDDLGMSSGAVYLYHLNSSTNNFNSIGKIIASDGMGGDEFGNDVAIDNFSILVGARQADYLGTNSGEAYLYYNNCELAELLLTSTQNADVNYETNGSIFSTQLGTNNSNINYDAGISIHLNPSFNIDLGTKFHAFIDGCL